MQDLMLMQMASGFGSNIDLSALIAFIAFAAAYFLAPVIGYEPYRPAALTFSLYALIAYAVVTLIQMMMQWVQLLHRPGGGMGIMGGGNELTTHFMFLFVLVKNVLFLIAMLAFVSGLRGLRLRQYGNED